MCSVVSPLALSLCGNSHDFMTDPLHRVDGECAEENGDADEDGASLLVSTRNGTNSPLRQSSPSTSMLALRLSPSSAASTRSRGAGAARVGLAGWVGPSICGTMLGGRERAVDAAFSTAGTDDARKLGRNIGGSGSWGGWGLVGREAQGGEFVRVGEFEERFS